MKHFLFLAASLCLAAPNLTPFQADSLNKVAWYKHKHHDSLPPIPRPRPPGIPVIHEIRTIHDTTKDTTYIKRSIWPWGKDDTIHTVHRTKK